MIPHLPPVSPQSSSGAAQAERRRIDPALAEAWRRVQPGADPAAAFDALVRQKRDADATVRRSLAQELDALTAPDLSDPTVFGGPRSLQLLRHVADTLLPAIDVDEETRSVTLALIREEIEARVACDLQRQIDAPQP
ncbi:hypothetical protein [Novosphingobium kaempferiae]|uniref:hypothetical protein n=1 Tax=Novosphingobium kaempferiae TaxID=2896849 RepID=UPI001E3A06B1|nr:hypothetical protein [Novosphingobium kaempferiae]